MPSLANFDATIVAPITPPGRGGVAIIRISGSQLESLIHLCFSKPPRRHREAQLTAFLDEDGSEIDQGLALYFSAPHSFTGEESVEFQGHGSPILVEKILKRLCSLEGVRMAEPGEFSKRAFFHKKIDLSQAEAICDLISSQSEFEAKAALATLRGLLSDRILELYDAINRLRTPVEAALDFFESPWDEALHQKFLLDFNSLLDRFRSFHRMAQQRSKDNLRRSWVLAGSPNAGKSTLFNQLLQYERAIVTPHAGTTRDAISETLMMEGQEICLVDTAGVRQTEDPIERLGIQKSEERMREAHLILWLIDASLFNEASTPIDASAQMIHTQLQALQKPYWILLNKVDLVDPIRLQEIESHFGSEQGLYQGLSKMASKSGSGVERFLNRLLQASSRLLRQDLDGEKLFLVRRRHFELITRALEALEEIELNLKSGGMPLDCMAEALRNAQNSLGRIVGKTYDEGMLDQIFSTFCLGK